MLGEKNQIGKQRLKMGVKGKFKKEPGHLDFYIPNIHNEHGTTT